jgi:hypothetical protein
MRTSTPKSERKHEREDDADIERELRALLSEDNGGGDQLSGSNLTSATAPSSSSSGQWWLEAEVKASLSAPDVLNSSSQPETAVTQLVARLRALHGHDKPLQSLLQALHLYAQRLQNTVVQVIGQQYPAFLLLHRRQAHLLSLTHLLRPSLTQLHDEVNRVLVELTRQLTVLTQRVQLRVELARKRRLCETFLALAESAERGEILLESVRSHITTLRSAPAADNRRNDYNYEEVGDPALSTALLLERTATHLVTMTYLLAPCRELPFALKINSRLTAYGAELIQAVREVMVHVLTHAPATASSSLTTRAALVALLRAFAALNDSSAYELLRVHFVAPRLRLCTDTLRPLAGDTHFTLESLFARILQFLEHDCRILLEAQSDVDGYDMLTNAIWPEIVQLLQNEAMTVNFFATGLADVFHRNFTATLRFLTQFEGYYSDSDGVVRFRNDSTYRSFMKRWNLSVYFHLRVREMTERLVPLLKSPPVRPLDIPLTASTHAPFRLAASYVLVDTLRYSWTPNVWLRPITHKLLKFNLQLLRAYQQFLRTTLASLFGAVSSPSPPPVSTLVTASGPENASASTPLLSVLVHAAVVLCDAMTLQTALAGLDSHLATLELDSTIQSLIRNALIGCVHSLIRDITAQLRHEVTATLCALVIGVDTSTTTPPTTSTAAASVRFHTLPATHTLQGVRTVLTTYRWSRNLPLAESSYIRAAVAPLVEWHSNVVKMLPPALVTEWLSDMSTTICLAYLDLINLQLSTLQRTYSFLQKMKKQTSSTSATTPLSSLSTTTPVVASVVENMSDVDKVALQLYLDVKYLGQTLATLGISLSNFEPWTKLWDVVKFAEKFQSNSAS